MIEIGMRLPNLMFLTRPCREFIALVLRAQGFDQEEVDDCSLVLEEAVNNSFEHACGDGGHTIEIDMKIDSEKWVFTIRDVGEGLITQEDFNFEGKGPPAHFGDRGRGLFLISSFSDQVRVQPIEGGGTELEITKIRKGMK